MGRRISGRSGAMMMMLLVVLIIGSIVALQLLPNEELIARRSTETNLNTEISQIREAFDLMRVASPTWDPFPDATATSPPTPASIAAVLSLLEAEGFLRNADTTRDPTVMPHQWGPGKTYYWVASENLASNSSFQISVDGITAWDWNITDTEAATHSQYLNDMRVDDYPYQNKLGEGMSNSGAALVITR